ncbi:hypothetical protein Lepto7376_3176 [[Leptolyngbya] sp. PCC 7376]|uniref:PTPA-CTERM sorting domain-containing protein n=1 Tax=[Leptolyngbya] sp. PCC 7376 TaxID=111781 RepID=UPI00029EDD38|nr:PTPA-CTERM sorting domain-containing protein [[Leptolyngbya] sp. PCC 7376]AFY39405.1 hypothetical protein Lepto7376_3176 [[Leptolyngbya] sp. PCC 7376]
MNSIQKVLLAGVGAIAANGLTAGCVGAMELGTGWSLTVPFDNLAPSAGADGKLRLLSGENEFSPGAFDGGFDIDELGEYFDLSVDDNIVGRYGCYVAPDIINLFGDIEEDGCSFDQEFSFVEDFALDIRDLINDDGSLIVKAIFPGTVEIPSAGNNLTVVLTTYGAVVPAVPTPTAVLPLIGGLFSSAYRRSRNQK